MVGQNKGTLMRSGLLFKNQTDGSNSDFLFPHFDVLVSLSEAQLWKCACCLVISLLLSSPLFVLLSCSSCSSEKTAFKTICWIAWAWVGLCFQIILWATLLLLPTLTSVLINCAWLSCTHSWSSFCADSNISALWGIWFWFSSCSLHPPFLFGLAIV